MSNNYSLRYTPESEIDINNIIEYIADDNPVAAFDLIEEIEHSIATLRDFPFKGVVPKDTQLRLKGIRLLIVKDYITFYIPVKESEQIIIIRILSGKQDYSSLF
jgi:toxin ParE1/3/4